MWQSVIARVTVLQILKFAGAGAPHFSVGLCDAEAETAPRFLSGVFGCLLVAPADGDGEDLEKASAVCVFWKSRQYKAVQDGLKTKTEEEKRGKQHEKTQSARLKKPVEVDNEVRIWEEPPRAKKAAPVLDEFWRLPLRRVHSKNQGPRSLLTAHT